jgi:hypothetical protein
VTPAVLNAAENRALVLRELDSGQQYPQVVNIMALAGLINAQFLNVNAQLVNVNAQFVNVNQRLDSLTAQTTNTRILTFNRLLPIGMGYRPLVKEAPGSGIALAIQLNPIGHQLPQQLAALQANVVAGNPGPPAALGQTPPFFDANIDGYRHGDILRLIEFYNEDFGIVHGDGLPVRQQKFRIWMAL